MQLSMPSFPEHFIKTLALQIMTLLDRPSIYQTEDFQDRFGAQARKNLTQEIARLHS